jgi:hypothetical protein
MVNVTVEDLLYGYDTQVVSRINTGAVERGQIYYSPLITPIYWKKKFPQNTFMVLTGLNGTTQEMKEMLTGQYI